MPEQNRPSNGNHLPDPTVPRPPLINKKGKGGMLLTPVPMGERRSSGASAQHTAYHDETHLLVDVSVAEIKGGCALGLVLEQLDESGGLLAAEMISTYVKPRAHRYVTTVKGSRLRIKWIQVGLKPASAFGVDIQAVLSPPIPVTTQTGEAGALPEVLAIDLTTLDGLRDYMRYMVDEANSARSSTSADGIAS